jgi:hypothetical protein
MASLLGALSLPSFAQQVDLLAAVWAVRFEHEA